MTLHPRDATTERARAAYHEAGHVVATLLLGGALRSVKLADDGGGLMTRDLSSRLSDFDAAVVCLAGSAAERRLADGCDPMCAATDRDMAYRFAARAGGLEGADVRPTLDRLDCRVSALVAEQWPAIERVALALMIRGALDDADCRVVAGLPPP